MRNEKIVKLPEVLDMIQEEPGNVTVDQILESIPQTDKKLQAFCDKLVETLSSELIDLKELELKRKKAQDMINNTEPVKALKRLKKTIKNKKAATDKLSLILTGVRSSAKAIGVELKNKKAISQGK